MALNIVDYQWVEIQPTTPIAQTSPIEFNVTNGRQYMIDMKKTRLAVKVRVMNEYKNKTAEKYATPVNLTLQSLFEKVDVHFQNKLISRTEMYPYKSMFDVILNTTKEEAHSKLSTQGFYLDIETAMEQTSPSQAPINSGLILRNNLVKDGQIVELVGPLYVDVLHQKDMLLDRVNMRIKLSQTNNAFRLLSTNPNAYLEIMDAKLWVYYAKIKQAVPTSLQYNFMQSETYTQTILAGNQSVRLDNMFQRRIPHRLIVALVDSDASVGDMDKNPYNFKHFKLRYMDVIVNGKSLPLDRPLELDFENEQFYMAYLTLFDGGCPCMITPRMYKSGYTMYQFFPPQTQDGGNVRLEMQFSEPLQGNTTLIVYSSFPKTLKINADRQIL
jgi:hypothetical protein